MFEPTSTKPIDNRIKKYFSDDTTSANHVGITVLSSGNDEKIDALQSEGTADFLDSASELSMVLTADEVTKKVTIPVTIKKGDKVTVSIRREKNVSVAETTIGTNNDKIEELSAYRILKLQKRIKLLEEQISNSQVNSDEYEGKIKELKLREGEQKMRSNSVLLYSIFFSISFLFFAFAFSMYLTWRLTGAALFDPGHLFFATLAGFGWSATAFTGILWSRTRSDLR